MNIHVKPQTTSTGLLPDMPQDQAHSALGASFGNLLSSLAGRHLMPALESSVTLPKPAEKAAEKAPVPNSSQEHKKAQGPSRAKAKEPEKASGFDREELKEREPMARAAKEKEQEKEPEKEPEREQRQDAELSVNLPTLCVSPRPEVPLPISNFQFDLPIKTQTTPTQAPPQAQPQELRSMDSMDFGISTPFRVTASQVDAMQQAVGQASDLQSKPVLAQTKEPAGEATALSELAAFTPSPPTAKQVSQAASETQVVFATPQKAAASGEAPSDEPKEQRRFERVSEASAPKIAANIANFSVPEQTEPSTQDSSQQKPASANHYSNPRLEFDRSLAEQSTRTLAPSAETNATPNQPTETAKTTGSNARELARPSASQTFQPSQMNSFVQPTAAETKALVNAVASTSPALVDAAGTGAPKAPGVNGLATGEMATIPSRLAPSSPKTELAQSAKFEDAFAKMEKLSDIFDQVRSMAVSGDKKADIEVRFELGKVQIHVEIDGKNVSVNFAADNAPLEQALRQRLPELQKSLSENGFSMGNTTFQGHGMNQGQGGSFQDTAREPLQHSVPFDEPNKPRTSSSQTSSVSSESPILDNGRLSVVA